MQLLNKADIDKIFSMKEAVEAVKEAFAHYSQGKAENPLRTNIYAKKYEGNLLFMPTYAEDSGYASLKSINRCV